MKGCRWGATEHSENEIQWKMKHLKCGCKYISADGKFADVSLNTVLLLSRCHLEGFTTRGLMALQSITLTQDNQDLLQQNSGAVEVITDDQCTLKLGLDMARIRSYIDNPWNRE